MRKKERYNINERKWERIICCIWINKRKNKNKSLKKKLKKETQGWNKWIGEKTKQKQNECWR